MLSPIYLRWEVKGLIITIIIAILSISGCGKRPPEGIGGFTKGYFKDKTSTVPGFSEGVGPTQTKTSTGKIPGLGRREDNLKKERTYDLGDEAPGTLTTRAWEALSQNDERGIFLFTERCIKLYEEEAKRQNAILMDYPVRVNIDKYQQLNNVGTCYFIRGEFFKHGKDWQKAMESYQGLIDNYLYAQCWDPRGWYWKPANIAKEEIRKIKEGYYEK